MATLGVALVIGGGLLLYWTWGRSAPATRSSSSGGGVA